MKIISSISIITLLLLSNTVIGQGYVFRVLANRGDNQVLKVDGTTQPLKTGAKLNAGESILAGNGAYIGLMHKTGKTIEVRTAGTTQVNDLEKKISAVKTGVANRYAQFVMNKMNEGDGDVNKNYRNNLKATGAVNRATNSSSIKVMLPSSIDLLNPDAIIRWAGGDEGTNYIVTVKNIFDEEIFVTETSETSVKIDFDADKLANERLVILSVKSKEDESVTSSDYGIKRMSTDDAKSINENLEILKAEVSDDSPLNKLIYASFYEENNLILDALTKYEEAVLLSPDVDDFKSIYDDFLIKNGLSK